MDDSVEQEAKRRLSRLTLEEKVRIIEDFRQNKLRNKDLCQKYGLSHSTVTNILSCQDKILENAENVRKNCGNAAKVKTYTKVHESAFEKSLYMWFIQKRNLGQPVPSKLLQLKAKQFHERFYGPTDFSGSDGWLQKFKKRHSLRSLSLKGERLSADPESAQDFQVAFQKFIKENNYDANNIYNADETALFWKLLPDVSLAAHFETEASNRKVPKDRVTLMVAANATGTHKVPLTMIGKAQLPICFRGLDLKNLPLVYRGQSKGWMNREIFIDWYKNVFLPSIKANNPDPNARFILVLDNAPSHPSATELNEIDPACFVTYLPPNVTSLVQPMDQGVISALKRRYKMLFLTELDAQDFTTTMGLIQFTKKWTLLNCSYLLTSSWNDITQNTLKNAWKKILSHPNPVANAEFISYSTAPALINRLPGCRRMNFQEVEEWMDKDDGCPPWKELNFEELFRAGSDDPTGYHDDDEEWEPENEDESIEDHNIVHVPIGTIFENIRQLCQWAQGKPEINSKIYFALNSVQEQLVHLRNEGVLDN